MKKNTIFVVITTSFFCFAFSLNTFSQHSAFLDADDARQRGYYDRPYKRYEAEPSLVNDYQGLFLPRTFDQHTIQSEASNQQALNLVNVSDFVQWTNSEAADGMTIRFSIPDGVNGGGTIGKLNLYVNDEFVQEIELNSFWAWQYFLQTLNPSYPDNTPASNKFPRMRFDEKRIKLANKIPEGAIFKLEKADAGAGAYTIDFVELEPIPEKVEAPEGAVIYEGDGSDLATFIANVNNQGKTIYIPEGYYEVPVRIFIHGNGTKLIGAGMWYSQLHFTASPEDTTPNLTYPLPSNPNSFNARGFESGASDVEVSGFYITTVNERRYATFHNNSRQVGKGFNGSFGTNSKISDVWVTHFECGMWIEGANGLRVLHSRFRSNYADGINLSRGCRNSIVEHCSFRNNGDDDMASWSRDNQATVNNTYRYNTSENCWRAAAIGFFGGKENKAHNIVIIDPIEAGIRVNNDFDAAPFSDDGYFEIRDISIYRAGNKPGTRGQSGDLWGNRTAAIYINSSSTRYDVRNIIMSDIDIYDSKGDAIYVQSRSEANRRSIIDVKLENIYVNTVNVSDVGNSGSYYGLRFDNAKGSDNNFCINFENVPNQINQTPPAGFTVNSNCNISTRTLRVNETLDLTRFTPEDLANSSFSVISGGTFVSVNNGIAIGLAEGTAQVLATNASVSLIFTIIVKDIAVTGITLSDETLELRAGQAYALTATIEPENATNKIITWSSSDPSIATISGTGRITARAEGTTIITVTTVDGRHIVTCVVTVVAATNIDTPELQELSIAAFGNEIQISGYADGEIISVYNLLGVKIFSQQLIGESVKVIRGLREGIYIVVAEKAKKTQKVIITK